MKYSLANYILSIDSNDADIKSMFGTISIGGEGSYLGSINLSRNSNMYDTTGYKTGGWVHNKNLDRTGTAAITLNQLAPQVGKFIQLANLFYSSDHQGFTLSLSDINGNKIATCIDCYFTNIPEQAYGESAENQTWTLTCGQVNYNS